MADGSRPEHGRQARVEQPVHGRVCRNQPTLLRTTLGTSTLNAYDHAVRQLEARERKALVHRVELRQTWDRLAGSLGCSSPEEARKITCEALCHLGQVMSGALSRFPGDSRLAEAVLNRNPVAWEKEIHSAGNGSDRSFVEQMKVLAEIVDAHWSSLSPLDRLRDFEVEKEIGRGGMGVVYQARQTSLARPVALKILSEKMVHSPEALKRFEEEAKALGALNHPNIVTIHSVESSESMHFIAMELVDGQSLEEMIPEGGMPLEQLLDLAIQLADALSSAHEHGIIHRDLKPGNIMVNGEGRVKILDFGLAKLRQDLAGEALEPTSRDRHDQTPQEALMGTVPYMSPEQRTQRPLDHRSDLFALGSTLYEMATGRQPFQGDTLGSMTRSILKDTPPSITSLRPDIPPELERIITHCLRKNPEDRYQTAKGLRNELEELKLTLRSRELPATAPAKTKSDWRKPALVIALALLAAAAVFVVDKTRSPISPVIPDNEKYLVVLPFTTLGGDGEGTALTFGLTETLSARLSRLTGAYHLSIAHATRANGEPISGVQEAGLQLGVNLAMTGSVQQHDQDLRVAIRLIDVRSNRQLRAEMIYATLDNPFDLQDRIAAAAVKMLEMELQPQDAKDLRVHGTQVAEAARLYIQGEGYLLDYSEEENVQRAVDAFRSAIQEDRAYAQAYAGLGTAYWHMFRHTQKPEWVNEALSTCRKSVALNDELADGHICLGEALVGSGRYIEATAEFSRATSLEPTSDEAFRGLGSAYQSLGMFDAAEETYLQAVNLRPHYWATYSWLGAFYASRGRLDESANCFRKVTELAPAGYRGYQNLGGVYLLQGRFQEALPVLERSVALKPSAGGYSNLATTWLALRHFDKAEEYNRKAIDLGTRDFSVWGNLGEACYWAEGNTEETRRILRKALKLAREQLKVNPSNVIALGEAAKYHALLGEAQEARKSIRLALELDAESPETLYNAALVHAALGNTEEALSRLEMSREAGMTAGWITSNPVFDSYANLDRFQQLLQ